MGHFSLDEYRALAEFRYQIRKFLKWSETEAQSSGLQPQQHQLLLAIKGLPESHDATVRELSERMHLRHHSTVELLDRLAAKNLVERRHSEADRREVLIALTPEGEELLRRLTAAHREELESAGMELLRTLRAVLRAPQKLQNEPE